MREIWANLPAQGQCLYPLLRSTSDLLMMPKDLLLEEGIRADMCSSVSGGRGGGGVAGGGGLPRGESNSCSSNGNRGITPSSQPLTQLMTTCHDNVTQRGGVRLSCRGRLLAMLLSMWSLCYESSSLLLLLLLPLCCLLVLCWCCVWPVAAGHACVHAQPLHSRRLQQGGHTSR